MKVLTLFPPNYREINKAFNVRGKPIIFAYGSAIYNPGRIVIPLQLLEHERVHLKRQDGDPVSWWRKYIDDPRFRLDEEIPAHIAEYQVMRPYDGTERTFWLDHIAAKLASPLYGSLIGYTKARAILVDGAIERSTDTTPPLTSPTATTSGQ